MGILKCDHIKRLITLTSDYIKRLSLYIVLLWLNRGQFELEIETTRLCLKRLQKYCVDGEKIAQMRKKIAPSFDSIMNRKHFATTSSHEGLMEEETMKRKKENWKKIRT